MEVVMIQDGNYHIAQYLKLVTNSVYSFSNLRI